MRAIIRNAYLFLVGILGCSQGSVASGSRDDDGEQGPAAPSISATEPASPATDLAPRIVGRAEDGVIVLLYLSPDCSGTPAASGEAIEFAAEGIVIAVEANRSTEISAKAVDSAGNTSVCSFPATYVHDDAIIRPVITAPAPNDEIAGEVSVAVDVSTAADILSAQLYVDGAPRGTPDGDSPFSLTFDAATLSTGEHVLTVSVVDLAGNAATSRPVRVFVDATPAGTPISCSELRANLGSGNYVLAQDCVVPGLTLNDKTLTVDNVGLRVEGPLVLGGSGVLRIMGGTLAIANTRSFEFPIITSDASVLLLKGAELITNADPTTATYSVTGNYLGSGRSLLRVEQATIDTSRNWLLGTFYGSSSAQIVNYGEVPTELYPTDDANVTMVGDGALARVWLSFDADKTGTLADLPSEATAFTYYFGRDTPETSNVSYNVDVIGARAWYGVESYPGSEVTIDDNEQPLTIGYFVVNPTAPITLSGLPVGSLPVTMTMTDQERTLTLRDVRLSVIPWQLYVRNDSPDMPTVTIRDSTVNELGGHRFATIEADNVSFQWAVLAAVDNSSLTIRDSVIDSQAVQSLSGSTVMIIDSELWGTQFTAAGPSRVFILNSPLHPNDCHPGCTPYCLGDVCNPFGLATPEADPSYLDARFVVADDPSATILALTIDPIDAPVSRATGALGLTGDVILRRQGVTSHTYTLAYRRLGGEPQPIAVDALAPVTGGSLGQLILSGLSDGDYEIILMTTVDSTPIAVTRPFLLVP